MSIDIARAGEGQAKQARQERTSSCKGQDGRPAEREGRGACCPQGGWCGWRGTVPADGQKWLLPPATNLDAQHRQVAAGFRACRIAPVVAKCVISSSPANPLRISCVSNRSRRGTVLMAQSSGEPSAGFVRVESLPLWHRANLTAVRRTSAGFVRVELLPLRRHAKLWTWIANPLALFGRYPRWRRRSHANSRK